MSYQGGAVDIDKEISYVIKRSVEKPQSAYSIMEEVRRHVGDDDATMREIEKKLQEKWKLIDKRANQISMRLNEKYPNFTKREALEKIAEYKKKFDFDDDVMQAIIARIFRRDDRMYPAEQVEYSPMGRALGFIPTTQNFIGKLNIPSDEKEQVRAIIAMNNSPQVKQIHTQATLQSLMYNVSDNLSQSAFDKFKTDQFQHISPVLFAMFFDKIPYFETNMILASIARIIAQRDEGLSLETMPDNELYRDIATDPNETECVANTNKPFSDLLNRCNVQIKLWQAVVQLRQGRYYVNDNGLFMEALNQCKSNVFDAGDLAYVKDEGTVMRKLLGVFSMRPSIVQTIPTMGIASNISQISVPIITRVPMLQLRFGFNDPQGKVYDLKSVLESEQHYISNKQIVIKKQRVMASTKIVVIYVNRRHHNMNLGTMQAPYSVIKLPLTINSQEKLFNAFVNVDPTLTVGATTFPLKSVVTVVAVSVNNAVDNTVSENLIISCAGNVILGDPTTTTNMVIRYEPLCISKAGAVTGTPAPPTADKLYPILQSSVSELLDEAKTRGTVFIYTTGETSMF